MTLTSASWPLQVALYAALTGHAPLQALVTGIFDRPPEDQAMPYVVIGESFASDWSTKTFDGQAHRLRLHIWDQSPGQGQTQRILALCAAALDALPDSIEGHRLVRWQRLQEQVLKDPDGYTQHGILELRAWTYPAPSA